eukprot:Awhi_evm1s12030
MAYAMARTWDLSWGNRPVAEVAKKRRFGKSLAFSFKMKGFLVLLAVMVGNFAVIVGLMFIDEREFLIYLSIGIMGVSLMQQLLSLYYYVFYTEHMMSSSLDRFKKTTLKIVCTSLFAFTVALLYTG